MDDTCKKSVSISASGYQVFLIVVVFLCSIRVVSAASPIANAGSDMAIVKNQLFSGHLSLDGTGSIDLDGDLLMYHWYGPFPSTDDLNPSVYIPEGTYTISLIVSDETDRSEVDTAIIVVQPCFSITARAKPGKVQLSWTHIDGTEYYSIYRSDENNPSSFEKIAETTSTYSSYLDLGITNEKTYLYVIGAVSEEQWCYSNVISAHPTAVRSRTIINYAPLIYTCPIEVGTNGITYNYDVNACDPRNSTLIYRLTKYPSEMEIDSLTGLISWVPPDEGSFDIEVQVSDVQGETDTQSYTLVVGELPPLNQPPIADAGGPYTGIVDQKIVFDGSGSYDPDGDDLVFQWDFGDGTTGGGVTTVHSYAEAGTYSVTLTVIDSHGASATDSVSVEVTSPQGDGFAYAYIANSGANDVSVIDLENNTVIQRVEVGQRPYGVEVSPDSERAYVTCEQGGIFVIDTSTNTVVDNIGVTASCIAVSPDCTTVYAVCPFENAISVIDASSNIITDTIGVRLFPHGIAISPDGTHVYVTNMLDGSVSVIDTSMKEIIEEIWISEEVQPKDIEITPDGSFVYVTSERRVWVIESSTNTVMEDIYLYNTETYSDPEYLAITPDGSYVYVTCEDGFLSIIETATNQMVDEMIFSRGLSDISFAPDGALLYTPDAFLNCVHITDMTFSGSIIPPVTEDLSQPYTCGHFIAVSKNKITGRVVSSPDGAGLEDVRLTLTGAGLVKAAVTDVDGQYTFYVPEGNYTISASRQGYVFSPESISVIMNHGDQTVCDIVVSVGIELSADLDAVRCDEPVTLTWDTINASAVSLDHGIGTVDLRGSITLAPEETTVYTITAENAEGASVSSSKLITVYQPPTISFSVEPVEIASGQSSTLSWSTLNAYEVSIDNGIGVVESTGTVVVNPTQTNDYTITAIGLGGTVIQTVTLIVYQPPVVSITTDPSEIIAGESATISWASNNADIITISPDIGDVGPNGSITVEPLETTTYTITASGPGGSASGDATVTVYQVPTVTISADPYEIISGQSTTLTWNSTDAVTANIDNGIGEVEVTGSLVVTPAQTTTYTVTVSGPGGSASGDVTVAVYQVPTVSITADPSEIITGQATTLAWDSTDSTTAVIDNGIGEVDATGTFVVTPTQTTTYTITISGPGGSASGNVVITVYQVPTVEITADPSEIVQGQTATLTWSSTDAVIASIDSGIGSVGLNGSYTLYPSVTTTYSITVTGPGGTATGSVNVVVIEPPIVTISADPQEIYRGESTVLFWNTCNVSEVIIDNGIGSVDLNGSFVVTPEITTTYTITAESVNGSVTDSITVIVNEPTITLTITSPFDGESIFRPDTMVAGTIDRTGSGEINIAVNGIPALVFDNQFVANHVPLIDGNNVLQVRAFDSQGITKEESLTAFAVTTGPCISLVPYDESGVSPLENTLKEDISFICEDTSIHSSGPGEVEYLDSLNEYEYQIRMTDPGVYYFTVEAVEGSTHEIYTDTVGIIVFDQADIDSLLRDKWAAMKSMLISNDIESALEYFAIPSRDEYREIFSIIGDEVSAMAAGMEDIDLVYLREKVAKYRIRKDEEIGGVNRRITYYIYFARDPYGHWYIQDF